MKAAAFPHAAFNRQALVPGTGRLGDHKGPFWITMDEVGALYEGNGEDGACSARASHAAELGLCLPLFEGISGRDGATQTPCLSQRLKRGPGLPEVPQLWYANHFLGGTRSTRIWRDTTSLYPDKQSQTKAALGKACILNRDLKGIKIIRLIWE